MSETLPPTPRAYQRGPADPIESVEQSVDVCVVGGGMAGVCAALAAARNGASVALVHDRPVLGGNASSEVRMWICGAHGRHNKETGLLEELQLADCFENPGGNYTLWDAVLLGKVHFCPGLTLHLNASCLEADVFEKRIQSITAWQSTTQRRLKIGARVFIDCSGDSILAALTGAEVMWGRESSEAFGEDIEPPEADGKTMGNSLLLQLRQTPFAQGFRPPSWAYRFDDAEQLPPRLGKSGFGANFWWIELGGLNDTIADAEAIRTELLRTSLGVWDFMKNHWQGREGLANWALDWNGLLPGKRESRRYVGGHVLTQNDVRAGGGFDDVVAYGGWSMDDHHPAGLYYPGPATIFHPAPSPFGIAYRCMYSESLDNLLCAGRNISVTHAALSATRVMATCATIGQAAGTAAALCVRHRCRPAQICPAHLGELQQTLMQDDAWLPGRARAASPLMRDARFEGDTAGVLTNGHDRPIGDASNALDLPPGESVTLHWKRSVVPEVLRLVFDSDLNDGKKLACRHRLEAPQRRVPATLVKRFRVEVQRAGGGWEAVAEVEDNARRLVHVPIAGEAEAVRLTPQETWGKPEARLFAMEVCPVLQNRTPQPPKGKCFSELTAAIPPEHLAPSHSEQTARGRTGSRVGA